MPAGINAIILTLILAACLYLTGNARVQLWDRDEPRYAQCSRQMLQSGDWVVPRLYDKLRFQKPPLIYWCQASAMKLFGSEGDAGAFSARLPSSIAMLATLVMLAIFISRQSGVQQAAWTVFIFATSAMTIWAAKSCLTDDVLILFVIGGQLCLYALWRGNRSWSVAMLLAIAVGLGMLTKGPFIIGIIASTGAALAVFHLVGRLLIDKPKIPPRGFEVITAQTSEVVPNAGKIEPKMPLNAFFGAPPNSLRSLAQIIVGVLIVAAMVAPWVYLVWQRAPDFLPAMLHEGRQHALEGKEGHHFPPGYHLVLVWPMFMPWSLLLPLAIGTGIKYRKSPDVRFALAAIVGPWIMVEFMGTKLPHYFLPAYPAMAYLVAFAIRKCLAGESKGIESAPFRVAAGFWAFAIAVVGALPWVAVRWFRPLPWGSMLMFSLLALIVGGLVFALFWKRRFMPAFIAMGVGMIVTMGAALHLFAETQYLRISTHIADTLVSHGATHPGEVKMVDYKEPSLAFYQGGTIREVEKKADLMYKPIAQWPHWVVITRDAWDMTPAATRSRLRVIDSCRGWAYADQGRVVQVMVVENSVY